MTNTTNPMEARKWFALREPINWAICIGAFVPIYFLTMIILGWILATVLCIAVIYFVFFFVLEKRAIGIECSCGKYVLTNTPWICGVCGHTNRLVDDFPFVGRCQNPDCRAEPKAYECHHCENLIFLTRDRQRTGFARCANYSTKSDSIKKRDSHQELVTDKNESIERKTLDVQETELDIQLKHKKAILNPRPQPKLKLATKTPRQEIEEFMKRSVGNEDMAEEYRAKIREEFKDDAVECEKRLRLVDEWMRSRL